MDVFNDSELRYLRSGRRLGRLATVGPPSSSIDETERSGQPS